MLGQLIVGRLVVGCSIGIISAQVPVWHTDCSSTEHRGKFVIFEGFCISLGITITEWVSFGLSFTTMDSAQWRGPLVFPVLFALFAIPFTFLMPESPRWLISRERHEEARDVLSALLDLPRDSPRINNEICVIQASLAVQKKSVWDLRKNGEDRLLHRTVLAMVAQMMQQLCAISALVFYTSDIFSNLGFSNLNSRVIGACLATFQTMCSVIPLFTVDRFGRRKLFMFTTIGLSVCTAVIAGTGAPHGFGGTTQKSIVAVVFTFLFDFFYPIGLLGLTFLYAAEISPTPYRVPITAIANAVQWLFQFMVAQITPPGTDSLKNRYWIIYAVLNATFAVIIFFFFPETSGRSLEEMDHIFRNTSSIFTVVETSRRFLKEKKQRMGSVVSPSVMSQDSTTKQESVTEIERV